MLVVVVMVPLAVEVAVAKVLVDQLTVLTLQVVTVVLDVHFLLLLDLISVFLHLVH